MTSVCQDSAEIFRLAMRRMAATVCILTTKAGDQAYGMTATSVCAVSMEPPALLFAVNQNASIHRPLLCSGALWVNLLGDMHHEQCFAFSGKLAGTSRFQSGVWKNDRGIPRLVDAQANIFCEIDSHIPFATHTIFIAQVIDTRLTGGIRPLIYMNGKSFGAPAFCDAS